MDMWWEYTELYHGTEMLMILKLYKVIVPLSKFNFLPPINNINMNPTQLNFEHSCALSVMMILIEKFENLVMC